MDSGQRDFSVYRVSTLLYCFSISGDVLLLRRTREPNRGLWSPCGGKVRTEAGESPYACACREAMEEIGLELRPFDLHLTGIVSEEGAREHWLMFLFEVKVRLAKLPPAHAEGNFAFFRREELDGLALPRTDRERIWPLFWEHRGGFFAAHCRTGAGGEDRWILEESSVMREPGGGIGHG